MAKVPCDGYTKETRIAEIRRWVSIRFAGWERESSWLNWLLDLVTELRETNQSLLLDADRLRTALDLAHANASGFEKQMNALKDELDASKTTSSYLVDPKKSCFNCKANSSTFVGLVCLSCSPSTLSNWKQKQP